MLVRLESRWRRLLVLGSAAGRRALAREGDRGPGGRGSPCAAGHQRAADLSGALAWDPGDPELHLRLARALSSGPSAGDLDEARRPRSRPRSAPPPTHAGTWLAARAPRRPPRETGAGAGGPRHRAPARPPQRGPPLGGGAPPAPLGRAGSVPSSTCATSSRSTPRAAMRRSSSRARSSRRGSSATSLMPAEPEALTGSSRARSGAATSPSPKLPGSGGRRSRPPVPDGLQRGYLELLLSQGQGTAARRVWLAMAPTGSPGRRPGMSSGTAASRPSESRAGGSTGRSAGVGCRGDARPLPGGPGPPVAPAGVQQLPDARLRRVSCRRCPSSPAASTSFGPWRRRSTSTPRSGVKLQVVDAGRRAARRDPRDQRHHGRLGRPRGARADPRRHDARPGARPPREGAGSRGQPRRQGLGRRGLARAPGAACRGRGRVAPRRYDRAAAGDVRRLLEILAAHPVLPPAEALPANDDAFRSCSPTWPAAKTRPTPRPCAPCRRPRGARSRS